MTRTVSKKVITYRSKKPIRLKTEPLLSIASTDPGNGHMYPKLDLLAPILFYYCNDLKGESSKQEVNITIEAKKIPTITGTNGSDGNLSGTMEDEVVLGLAGNDSLYGGYGNDTLDGGDGKDTAILTYGDDVIEIKESPQRIGDYNFVLKNIECLFGDRGNDTLRGNKKSGVKTTGNCINGRWQRHNYRQLWQ